MKKFFALAGAILMLSCFTIAMASAHSQTDQFEVDKPGQEFKQTTLVKSFEPSPVTVVYNCVAEIPVEITVTNSTVLRTIVYYDACSTVSASKDIEARCNSPGINIRILA